MKKLILLFIIIFTMSCTGSKSETISAVKEQGSEIKEVNKTLEEGITLEKETKEAVADENTQVIKDIEGDKKSTKEESIEEILALEEEKNIEKPKDWKMIRTFEERVPSKENIKYKGELPKQLNYVIVLSQRVNLREKPTTKSKIISSARNGERLEVLELVENGEEGQWYKIKKQDKELFVYKKIVALREFRFEKAETKINELEKFIGEAKEKGKEVTTISAYIPNPNNKELLRKKDKYGNVEDQSARGYYGKERVYIPDGTIVAIEKEINGKYRIKKQGGDEPYLDVPKSRLNRKKMIEDMPRKVIVIDIENQNFTVYEKILGEWNLISYVYSKTGIESKLGFKTPRGDFMVLAVKKVMTYNDSKGISQGYARNAIRFSGGGYIHGTPFNLKEKDQIEKFRVQREATLGSYAGTRKCVRNSVEHSVFLFDWVVGKQIKDGNFQGIEEDVAVIIM